MAEIVDDSSPLRSNLESHLLLERASSELQKREAGLSRRRSYLHITSKHIGLDANEEYNNMFYESFIKQSIRLIRADFSLSDHNFGPVFPVGKGHSSRMG